MTKKRKLELTWIEKENRPRLEPRILLEDPEKSYHAAHRVTDHDRFDNRLIFGDNLLALKALEQEFSGRGLEKATANEREWTLIGAGKSVSNSRSLAFIRG